MTVFFFGYTRCPDICPLVMADLAVAVARLPGRRPGDVQVVLVTSDPARDDPAVLRAYLDRFDPDFTGLTGDLDTIVAVADDDGRRGREGRRLPSGGYEVRTARRSSATSATRRRGVDRTARRSRTWQTTSGADGRGAGGLAATSGGEG